MINVAVSMGVANQCFVRSFVFLQEKKRAPFKKLKLCWFANREFTFTRGRWHATTFVLVSGTLVQGFANSFVLRPYLTNVFLRDPR